jgi:hypothetical protein
MRNEGGKSQMEQNRRSRLDGHPLSQSRLVGNITHGETKCEVLRGRSRDKCAQQMNRRVNEKDYH